LWSLRLFRSGRGILEYLAEFSRRPGYHRLAWPETIVLSPDKTGHIVAQSIHVNAVGCKYVCCVGVLRQREQEILDRHHAMSLMTGVTVCAFEARREICRFGNPAKLIGKFIRHQALLSLRASSTHQCNVGFAIPRAIIEKVGSSKSESLLHT